jgi:hypothetical protein
MPRAQWNIKPAFCSLPLFDPLSMVAMRPPSCRSLLGYRTFHGRDGVARTILGILLLASIATAGDLVSITQPSIRDSQAETRITQLL